MPKHPSPSPVSRLPHARHRGMAAFMVLWRESAPPCEASHVGMLKSGRSRVSPHGSKRPAAGLGARRAVFVDDPVFHARAGAREWTTSAREARASSCVAMTTHAPAFAARSSRPVTMRRLSGSREAVGSSAKT